MAKVVTQRPASFGQYSWFIVVTQAIAMGVTCKLAHYGDEKASSTYDPSDD